MIENDFNKKLKDGEVEMVGDKQPPVPPELLAKLAEDPNGGKDPFADYASIIEALRKVKPFVSTAPTNVPKSFIDGIVFYNSGGTYRVYFYINKSWRYATLT